MLSSLSSCQKIGPFPPQHLFWVTDLVQMSGIEWQQLGCKILAPRFFFFFTVVSRYRDSDIAGEGEVIARQRQMHMWASPWQPRFRSIEFLSLDFHFHFYYVLHESVLMFLRLLRLSLSLSLPPDEEFTSKNALKSLQSLCSRVRYELSHLRRTHQTHKCELVGSQESSAILHSQEFGNDSPSPAEK